MYKHAPPCTKVIVFTHLRITVWKKLHNQSAKEYGTLGYFQALLHLNTVKANVKKSVDANLEFLDTMFKGNILACSCKMDK